MSMLTIAFLGDVVGEPGVRAFAHASETLRHRDSIDLLFVNGENARNGSGLSPDNYKALRRAGADAITLGDHCFKDSRICDFLDDGDKPLCRPANLSPFARGKTRIRIGADPASNRVHPPVYIITVLGRIYMSLPADDPFAAIDREVERIAAIEPDAIVIVEAHTEATSEKIAIAWHCLAQWPGRVLAVVGTHTHVQTADARVLDGRLGAITDLGMCGGRRGVIGRDVAPVLSFMTRQSPASFLVASEDLASTGCLLRLDVAVRRCVAVEPVVIEGPPSLRGSPEAPAIDQ
jgi:metallophosphoesterase (TIGR00282 family)